MHVTSIMIGDSSTGKSSIVSSHEGPTIGVDYVTKTYTILQHSVKFRIWDTGGTERFHSITAPFCRSNMVCFVTYDVTNRQSFESVSNWVNMTRALNSIEKQVIVLIANKIDMIHDRVVSTQEGQDLADQLGIVYMETSAKDTTSIDNMFRQVGYIILHQYKKEITITTTDKRPSCLIA